jgi:hypothetical protein
MSQQETDSVSRVERPWWREPMVWMVIGLPAVVVVASFVTLGLALKYPDPVLDEKSSQQVPALKARNHAATGGR